ncbi:MAG TPA: polyketide synthase dehydratase domain-containing protein, partial [Acetobacteraceae bacterium]|nr:polyketide synthase dehydratase domain-containing protein [Acetobacteraceae bacterium]
MLTDHRVHGLVIIPAATVLEVVLAGAVRAFGAARRLLRDVVFQRPLVLADAQPRTVQLVLQGDPPGPVLFECYGLERGTPGSPAWSLLASGAIDTSVPDVADDERHLPEVIQARCPDAIGGPAFYRLLAEHGLQYGPGFQAVAKIWRREGEAIAQLTPSVAGSSMGQAFQAGDCGAPVLAPVLDGCFQVLAATLPLDSSQSRDTYLPVGVSELRDHGTFPDRMWCHALLRAGLDPEPGTIEGDVFLLRENGQVVVAVRGLRLRRIPAAELVEPATGATDLGDMLYELRWRPAILGALDQDAPGRPVDVGSWLIFSDGSTTSDVLRDLLKQHSQTCVFVEPGIDFVRLGSDSYRLDPAQPQHFRRLLTEAFGGEGETRPPCRGVLHLWSLMAAVPAQTSTDSLESARVLGAVCVLHLVQALTQSGWPDTPRLWLVTRGAQAIGDDAETVSIAQAPLWGMGRSIDHEHPELRCSRVDLSSGGGVEELGALVRELCADTPEADVALRGSRRFVARLARYGDDADARTPARCAAPPAPDTDLAFRMEYPVPGALDDVRARAAARRPPGSEEVEIRVHAAGLNFIDAMRALGVYPGQDGAPVRVGIECAGTVTAVGECAGDLRVGDAVIALAMDGIGSFVTTR